MGSTNGIGRYNATFMSCLPNFGVKRLHADVWSSFTVRNFSMIIDMYTCHVLFIQQRSGIVICFGDNTMVRGCLCSLKVRCELSQREITFFSGNLSRRSIIITSQYMTHLHFVRIILFRSRINVLSKMMLVVGKRIYRIEKVVQWRFRSSYTCMESWSS